MECSRTSELDAINAVRSNNTNKWNAQEQTQVYKFVEPGSNNTNKWNAQERK